MPVALEAVLDALHTIAPLRLAEDWDNVGLLVDHARPRRVARVLLTIDLTEAVLAEARARRAGLIVAYHPPLFRPVARLLRGDALQRVVLGAVRDGIAIYSPHTALDAVEGGVNDWLADGLGPGDRRSLAAAPTGGGQRVVATLPVAPARALADALERAGATLATSVAAGDGAIATVVADGGGDDARRALDRALAELPDEWQSRTSVMRLEPRLSRARGQGRLVELARPQRLAALVRRIKRHLRLPKLRVATAPGHERRAIRTVALCAGAGGSVVASTRADLLWTGEMRHHDVLAALARGSSVVLCDHSNTERGYLPRLARHLAELAPVEVEIAAHDREPLRVV